MMDQDEEFWTSEDILRWYERGSEKLRECLRLDKLIPMLLDINVYFSEVKGLNLHGFEQVKHSNHRIICVDAEDFSTANLPALKACEHLACHRITCKFGGVTDT